MPVPNANNGLGTLEVNALRAAFGCQPLATSAWEMIRDQHSFRTMPDQVARLCGQIYRNTSLPEEHPDRDRLRGAFKSNHVHGTLQLSGVVRGLNELERLGIPYLIVKGAAVGVHMKTFGVRRLGDIDVAVSINDVERAFAALADLGFSPKFPERWDTTGRRRWRSCGPLVNGAGAELDLMVSGTSRADLISMLLSGQATKRKWMDHNIRVANPEQTIILSLVHGFQGFAESDFLQSLADVVMLLNITDKKRLFELANQCRLSFMLDMALGVIKNLDLSGHDQKQHIPAEFVNYAKIRRKVLQRQGRYRPSSIARGIYMVRLLSKRWRGFKPVTNILLGSSVSDIAYRAWLVCFQIAKIERVLINIFGTMVPPDQIITVQSGSIVMLESKPFVWESRFRLEWSEQEPVFLSLIADMNTDEIHIQSHSVYDHGQFIGCLPEPNSSPLIFVPKGKRKAAEISIRLPDQSKRDIILRYQFKIEKKKLFA
jgi:hypothetical protein